MKNLVATVLRSGPRSSVGIIASTVGVTILFAVLFAVIAGIFAFGSLLAVIWGNIIASAAAVGTAVWLGTAWARAAGKQRRPAVFHGASAPVAMVIIYFIAKGNEAGNYGVYLVIASIIAAALGAWLGVQQGRVSRIR